MMQIARRKPLLIQRVPAEIVEIVSFAAKHLQYFAPVESAEASLCHCVAVCNLSQHSRECMLIKTKPQTNVSPLVIRLSRIVKPELEADRPTPSITLQLCLAVQKQQPARQMLSSQG